MLSFINSHMFSLYIDTLTFLCVLIGHFYVLFDEMFKSLAHFKLFFILLLLYFSIFYILVLYCIYKLQIFSPGLRLTFLNSV